MVHHVHVAVARELDAQILDLDDRRLGALGLEAVGALHFGLAQLGKGFLQALALGGVGGDWIDEQTILLTLGFLVFVGFLDRRGRSGHHGVGDALGQDVEAQHGDHDHQAREQRLPPVAEDHAFLGGGQDVAPRRGRLRNAQINEGQGRLEHDRVGDAQGGEHHNRGGYVAHHMLVENPRGAGAGDDDRAHVVLAVLADDVRAHDAGDLRHVQDADGCDDAEHGLAENRDEHGGEGDARHGHEHVDDAHDDFRDPRAGHGRDRADERAQHQGEQDGQQADDERIPCAVEHAGHHVAPNVIGAEQVLGGRRLIAHGNGERILRRDHRRGDGHDDQQRDKQQREPGSNGHFAETVEFHSGTRHRVHDFGFAKQHVTPS